MIRKVYLDTDAGQVHARTIGEGTPLFLLHTTPGSGKQFEHVLPLFAEQGFQVWALDLLGNGRSDPVPKEWSFETAAKLMGQAIDETTCESIVLAGGHMSGQVAIELAAQRPELLDRLIVDSIPMWDYDKRLAITSLFDLSNPSPNESGAHLLTYWERAYSLHKAWNAAIEIDSPRLFDAIVVALEHRTTLQAQEAFLAYEVQPRLSQLGLPILITAATEDSLYSEFEPTMRHTKNGLGYLFQGPHPTHCSDRGAEYVRVVNAFVHETRDVEFLRND